MPDLPIPSDPNFAARVRASYERQGGGGSSLPAHGPNNSNRPELTSNLSKN